MDHLQPPSRRAFLTSLTAAGAAAWLLPSALGNAQYLESAGKSSSPGPVPSRLHPTRPDVAAIDRDAILTTAARLLSAFPTQPLPRTLTSVVNPRSAGTRNDYSSEPEEFYPDPTAGPESTWLPPPTDVPSRKPNPAAFTAHRDLLQQAGYAIATLTAAFVLTGDTQYSTAAAASLRAWFVTPSTRMNPSLTYAQTIPFAPPQLRLTNPREGRPEGVAEAVPLAEIAQSIPFLATSTALTASEITGVKAWFASYLDWLSTSRLGGLARDHKDHIASAWLLQSSACAHLNTVGLTSDDSTLAGLRHHLYTSTLRAQISPEGFFPHEVTSANPYRNSIFNLDLLAAACDLLSNRFESAWMHELPEGPSMRVALAWHAPFIANRAAWPYPADPEYFALLPSRPASLLLGGRAFSYPDYTLIWQSLKPITDSAPEALLAAEPIHQPLLWVTRPQPSRA